MNYNFAFFDQVPNVNWDSDYQAYIPIVLATETDYDYYRALKRFCALLQDGHTNVYMPRRIDSLLYRTSFGDYRLFLENIGGRAIVTHVNEPKKEEIVLDLIPRSLKTQLYKATLDSHASEHGARMTAMHKATDNATELRDALKLQYNKARQAAITNEILEIVGGAEALAG